MGCVWFHVLGEVCGSMCLGLMVVLGEVCVVPRV